MITISFSLTSEMRGKGNRAIDFKKMLDVL